MALLFSDVVNKYNMQKNEDTVELTAKVADFLDGIELDEIQQTQTTTQNSVFDFELEQPKVTPQRVFVASVASEYYSKAIEDIANTKVGNKAVRKKNFKQVMQESFFYGSNRFGTNFIA
ncbi:hypothetical protein IKJ53_04295 [bacterium]|nr:hypothetical protein [bacterium]